jgi:hypothetical protein
MPRLELPRNRPHGLLTRPPWTGYDIRDPWRSALVDPVGQLEELADLYALGLVSREEFDEQKAKVLGPFD